MFRREHGRAVAVLVRSLGDISLAEEVGAGSIRSGTATLARSGMPPAPAGWIITTARNRAIDRLRREASRGERHAAAMQLAEQEEPREHDVQDERLRLIFTCCHPALGARDTRRPDAEVVRRTRHRGDRARLSRARIDDGATTVARQGQDPRRRNSLSRARGRGACRRDSAPCSRWCIWFSTKATAPRPAQSCCASKFATRRSASVGCCSSCCRRNPKCAVCSH